MSMYTTDVLFITAIWIFIMFGICVLGVIYIKVDEYLKSKKESRGDIDGRDPVQN